MPVFLSDTHAHAYAGSRVTAEGANQRLLDVIAAMDMARLHAERTRQSIIHCGDLFHDRKGVKPEVLHRVGEWLERCQASSVKVYILAGNHDMSIHGDGTSSVRGLAGEWRTIIDTPVVIPVDGVQVGFLPYVEDPKVVDEEVLRLNDAGAEILVAHLGLGDPQHADCVPVDYEVPGAISTLNLHPDKFDQIFLGHYHNHQRIFGHVHYVGSPLQLSFKEVGQRKGFMSWQRGKSPRFVENLISPRYFKVEGDMIPAEVRPEDHVWCTGLDRDAGAAVVEQLRGKVGSFRVDIARREEVAARIPSGVKGADLLRAYIRTVAPQEDPAEVEELVALGADLVAHSTS